MKIIKENKKLNESSGILGFKIVGSDVIIDIEPMDIDDSFKYIQKEMKPFNGKVKKINDYKISVDLHSLVFRAIGSLD